MLYSLLYIGAFGVTQQKVGTMSLELILLLVGVALVVVGFFVTGIISTAMFIIGGGLIGYVIGLIHLATMLWSGR